ncbi:hypothetical protein HH308_22775 [Gordonia sp. TBRC 11910]|uniref:Uncharacterized protein n=1 Tax=Gordonia asplenii TaxID=2725283 RepID=A0A848L5W1_9ACTN|nr:hypothetical protein [Gordonia asplenii]NMO04043.1 hypothetical protein [Gordonia asplenii]
MATKTTTKTAATAKAKGTKKKSVKQTAHLADFLSSFVDSTKDVLDDLIDTAADVEKGTRRRVVDIRDSVRPTDKNIESIRKQVISLTDSVEKLSIVRKTA